MTPRRSIHHPTLTTPVTAPPKRTCCAPPETWPQAVLCAGRRSCCCSTGRTVGQSRPPPVSRPTLQTTLPDSGRTDQTVPINERDLVTPANLLRRRLGWNRSGGSLHRPEATIETHQTISLSCSQVRGKNALRDFNRPVTQATQFYA
ncbi:hypothetical protein BDU57DRAFT_531616 [Ampelomyces quisqualis]|uniref:Uncharacterized protein n=1 Tax=Ampelomyces quisqualis TaxID=50730 RepID=A0A6A5QEJ5_AMPQU|nr:hypothetical protein BDU57DRAFT_531616 [Ampelomyces quisqualis]